MKKKNGNTRNLETNNKNANNKLKNTVGKVFVNMVSKVVHFNVNVNGNLNEPSIVTSAAGFGCMATLGGGVCSMCIGKSALGRGLIITSVCLGCAYVKLDKRDNRYKQSNQAHEERMAKIKHPNTPVNNGYAKARYEAMNNEELSTDDGENEDYQTSDSTSIPWMENFHNQHPIPAFYGTLDDLMKACPDGYEDPMLLTILENFGAMIFSKVRAYGGDILYAPNIQVVIEGESGSGKSTYKRVREECFKRVIESDRKKFNAGEDGCAHIIQTIGIEASVPKFTDIMADNQGVHVDLFVEEIKSVKDAFSKSNGLSSVYLRKAFDNDAVCRINKSGAKQGVFDIYMNYTFTGTHDAVEEVFKNDTEGGTVQRQFRVESPDRTECTKSLDLPRQSEMEKIRDLIDDYRQKYCYTTDAEGNDIAVKETIIDLGYVWDVLGKWEKEQWQKSRDENNHARGAQIKRAKVMAFNCAIVVHMLYGNPTEADTAVRIGVGELTKYLANLAMESYLHYYGKEHNVRHERLKNNSYVDVTHSVEKKSETETMTEGSLLAKSKTQRITDPLELKFLHDIKDEKGHNKYGWDTLAKMSGVSPNTVKNRVQTLG